MENPFSTKGRIGRASFIRAQILIAFLIIDVTYLLNSYISSMKEPVYFFDSIVMICFFIYVLAIVFFVVYNIKRLHDLNSPGWLALIPISNIYFFILNCFIKGTEGSNKYGDDPVHQP